MRFLQKHHCTLLFPHSIHHHHQRAFKIGGWPTREVMFVFSLLMCFSFHLEEPDAIVKKEVGGGDRRRRAHTARKGGWHQSRRSIPTGAASEPLQGSTDHHDQVKMLGMEIDTARLFSYSMPCMLTQVHTPACAWSIAAAAEKLHHGSNLSVPYVIWLGSGEPHGDHELPR